MGLFDAIFRPAQAKESQKALNEASGVFSTLTAYRPAFTNWNGMLYESELVRAAIDARARHISKLKIEIQGAAQPSLQVKMRQGPNQWQTYSQFLYRVSTILDCNNTAFIVPVFDEYMAITGYYPVLPQRCTIVEYKGEPWLRYYFGNGNVAAVEFRKCAVLTKFQYANDFFGSDNRALDDVMGLIHMTNQGIKEGIKTSANYSFMAQLSNFATPDDIERERQRFTANNLGQDANGKSGLLLFPNTYANVKQIDYKPYNIDSKQMEYIRTNVFNYFGVNEDVLQNKAYGDAWSAFYEGCVEWFAVQFSESMTKAIFSERERAQGSGLMATSNRLQYLSNADKLEVSAQMADRGLMTTNEIRDIWNLPPVEGGDSRTIRGEYYAINEDGTVSSKDDDQIGGSENGEE